jgi:DNA invertase Pin-like site-specific DNA recombinase
VTRLDRLARSTRDLLNILHALAEKGAKFKSLADPWCDTSTPQGELLVTVLAGFATFERHLIKARTDDGRKRAKERGVRFGRPRKLDQHQRQEALQRLANGETLVDVARTFGVDATTIGRLSGSVGLRQLQRSTGRRRRRRLGRKFPGYNPEFCNFC